MASVTLKNVKKIYPFNGDDAKKKKKKKGEETTEKKVNLQITDKGVVAVQEFSLDIKDKEFIVLVGPSGCGKSTTLRMVAGLEEITEGELYIDGKLMNDVAPKDRDIAMVFQNYALYPHMTVYENMAFSLKLRKEKKDVIDKKVREAAENLDAKLRNQMRAEIIKLRERIDTTFIYVTHDQTEAMTLGDRIVIMRDGYIQQIGTPQEVFNNPRNLFVAGFIGTPQMNFFDAKLVREGEKFFVELGGYRVELDAEKEARLLAKDVQSQEVTLGVRPEHTTIGETGIAAKVDVSEMMGSSVHLHVSAEGKDVIIIVPTIDMKGHYAMGDTVHFSFDGNVAHVFSKENEKNLEW